MRLQARPRNPRRCLSLQEVAIAAMVVLSRSDSQTYGFQLFSIDHSRTRRRIRATALFQATATEQESSVASAIAAESASESVETGASTLHLQDLDVSQSYDVSLDGIGSLEDENTVSRTRESEPTSRRIWLSEMAKSASFLATATTAVAVADLTYQSIYPPKPDLSTPKRLAPVNITQVAQQTNINITLQCQDRICISLDSTTFQKKLTVDLPTWLPKQLVPSPRVIKDIPNSELWIAAVVAGSAVEMTRNALLYPLQTLKTRIQTDINTRQPHVQEWHWKRRCKIMQLNAIRHFREGQLYAGLLPTLLVSVPATGVYYATRDVSKRMIIPLDVLGDVSLAVVAAFVGDVVSLVFRAPADTLALRLQSATGEESVQEQLRELHGEDTLQSLENNTDVSHVVSNGKTHGETMDIEDEEIAETILLAVAEARVEQKVGNWFLESLERLPAIILTDLPYLLSRIAVNSWLLQGKTVNVGTYEVAALMSALLCAFLTTPFDVARTRILVDSDNDGTDGGRGKGVIETFQLVMQEGDGGARNLFAGWIERCLYLGISSLWLPFSLLGYMAIRDTILLEIFE